MRKYILLILGLAILIPACWHTIGVVYFPYNLPFCFIGGLIAGRGVGMIIVEWTR